MIWLLFAAAAGVATWAAMATRSGAMDRQRGRPLMWGAGVTAAAVLALVVYEEVQRQRMVDQIMGTGVGLLARVEARADDRRAEFRAERNAFDRDFEQRRADFDRSFKEQGDRIDRAFEENRAVIEGDRTLRSGVPR